MELKEIWQTALNDIEINISRASFITWFKNSSLIKKEGSRMVQKDIVQKTGLSEAKISLMITDLESKGIIRKIKKGRANIIILNK